MGQRTLPATTARHNINARKPRWAVLCVALRGFSWDILGIDYNNNLKAIDAEEQTQERGLTQQRNN